MSEAEPAAPAGRLGRRSLTFRLVVGALTLVVVLVSAIGAATYLALRAFISTRLDQQVRSSAGQNAAFVDRCLFELQAGDPDPCGGNRGGPPQTVHEWVAIKSPGPVRIQIRGGNVTDFTLTSAQRATFEKNPSQVASISVGGSELRATGQQTRHSGVLVVTGLATTENDRTLGRLLLLELGIGAAAIVLAGCATGIGVRRSLRNLHRVTDTAQEVAAELATTGGGLDRRVPVAEQGTEVGQLAQSMNTLLDTVEDQFSARVESERRMRQFLADASHELRTPLTSIRGYAELARMQRAATGSAPEDGDNLDRIEFEGTRMSRLVDDLLLLARGDAPDEEALPTTLELVDVDDLLRDAVDGSRAAFPERGITLDIAPAPEVLGDRDRLLRVVRNLITNAAVHTAPDRPIQVRADTDRATGEAVISVVDGGPGLPPEDAARVFERFWRADKARTRARGGSGLGMSIVATIVGAHGGTVRFDSSVEAGSTVTVRLPPAAALSTDGGPGQG